MRILAYYTLGYQASYIEPLALSIKSLLHFNPDVTVWILCDEHLIEQVRAKIPDIPIFTQPRSPTPEVASMQKLSIFSQDLSGFDKVIYIDSDILVGLPIHPMLERVTNPEKLYVYAESTLHNCHTHIYFSLQNYTTSDLQYFINNHIYVFNAGLFAFIPTDTMRAHFAGVNEMIRTHRGSFFYEQSFMNVYFNKRNLADYSIFVKDNYTMHASNHSPKNTLLHFSGSPGAGESKTSRMTSYAQIHMPYLLT